MLTLEHTEEEDRKTVYIHGQIFSQSYPDQLVVYPFSLYQFFRAVVPSAFYILEKKPTIPQALVHCTTLVQHLQNNDGQNLRDNIPVAINARY